jgi:hypothetical protein
MTLAYFFLTKMGRCSVRLVQESFPVCVVEYDFELPRSLRPDGPCDVRGGENTRTIFRKLRAWRRHQESPESNSRHMP